MATFIPKQPLPTQIGWHYGRPKPEISIDRKTGQPWPIVPYQVKIDIYTKQLVTDVRGYPLEWHDWFGPVPEVREATVQTETTEGEVANV